MANLSIKLYIFQYFFLGYSNKTLAKKFDILLTTFKDILKALVSSIEVLLFIRLKSIFEN